MRYRQLSFALLALFLAACGGQLASDGGVSGTWTGQLAQGSVPITLTLVQSGSSLTGGLTVNNAASPAPLTGTALNSPDDGTTLISLSGQGDTSSIQLEASTAGSAMRGSVAFIRDGNKTTSTFTASQ